MAQDELKQWLGQDDHFYADKFTTKRHPRKNDFEKLPPSGVRNCSKCFHARQDALREEDELKQSHRRLRGLELFAGAGGLSAGLDQAGFVETKWAVEWTTSAALTYAYVSLLPAYVSTLTYILQREPPAQHCVQPECQCLLEACHRKLRGRKPTATS